MQFNILLIAIHDLAPKYLCDLLTFKSSLYNLRSSDSILLSMPAVRWKTLGDRAFMVAAPRLCHISALLRGLHWLPVKARIGFKILLIMFKAIHGLAPVSYTHLTLPTSDLV